MKKAVTVQFQEIDGEGLMALLGKRVMLFCLNYIYSGVLLGVNDTCVLLEDSKIVYLTGAFDKKNFEDAQSTGFNLYIQTSAIEAFCETDKK